jgi:hypothetical protein
MLVSPYIEDFFVLSSIHDHPLRIAQLEGYMHQFIRLIETTMQFVDDEKTIQFLQHSVRNAQGSWENLGKVFFNDAKRKLGIHPDTILWAKDFPTITIFGSKTPSVFLLNHKNIAFLEQKRTEIQKTLQRLCDTYCPHLLIAVPTIQMENVLMPKNTEVETAFKKIWALKKLPKSDLKKLVKIRGKKGWKEFELKVMNESYRQVVIAHGDFHRAFRRRLYKSCFRGEGNQTLFSDFVLLQLAECIYTLLSIDSIISIINEFNVPVIILENRYLSLYVPLISKQDKLPFHEELSSRDKRYQFFLSSSKSIPEENVPSLNLLNQTLSAVEKKLLSYLNYRLEQSLHKMVFIPKEKMMEIFGYPLDIEKEVILEWTESEKCPFVKVVWKGEEHFLATRNIIEDQIFRISWMIHQATHIKLRGSKYEDFVLETLRDLFPESFTSKNKFFWGVYEGEKKRLEIDRIFVDWNVFFMIECKNLRFIEDTSNFKALKSRELELKKYGEYLSIKASELSKIFSQIESKIPELKEYNCSQIAPVILYLYPDIISNYQVPFLTIYEFVRYLYSCKREKKFLPSFTDFSSAKFEMHVFDIVR